ncbi:hypothetical protein Q3G72_023571 [Acer saccharum]|nr:hypothetical protein Q3G72_023571 [Acer saccharum]
MNSHLFSSSPFLSLVGFLLVVFAKIQSSSSYPYGTYESCRIQFQCGNITAGYPFWGESPQGLSRWEGCGHPELKLKCEHDLATTMMIKDVKYLVLYIKSEDRTLRIARMDYLEPEGICSPAFPNTTVNHELFDYSDWYEDVTFLYDCPAGLPLEDCTGAVEHKNFSIKVGAHGPGMCDASVFFPVLKNSSDRKAIDDVFWRPVLHKGFELKWKLKGISCEECTNSKGSCGSEPFYNETICFCPNQPNQPNQPIGSSNACRPGSNAVCGVRCGTNSATLQLCQRSRFSKLHHHNNPYLSYPFWGEDRSEYCGYPGFKVDCNSDVPEINIAGRIYRVLKIDSPSNKVIVAIQDYWDNNCPKNSGNSPLNFTIFDYSPDTRNITLYYGCPVSSANEILPYRFNCSPVEPNSNTANYFLITSEYFGSCASKVQFSVSGSTIQSIERYPYSANLTAVVRNGFGLQWNANNSLCDSCQQSNGLCGHDSDNSEFICYCTDQPHPYVCPNKGTSYSLLSLGLVFLLLCPMN